MDLFVDYVDGVEKFMRKAGQNPPQADSPVHTLTEEERVLRAKLVYEEAMELINKGLGVDIADGDFKISRPFSMVETIDGACDLIWVGVAGVSVACNVDLEGPLQEVYRSNMSKFIDGYRRDDGKWVKGPSYSPADIAQNISPRIPF